MKTLSLLALSLFIAACARPPAGDDHAEAAPASTTMPPLLADAGTTSKAPPSLTRHHWRLQEAHDRNGHRIDALFIRGKQPLTLDFADGRLGISETCNHMGGAYTTDGDTLRVSRLVSTMMACADARLLALDKETAKRVEGDSHFTITAGESPRLSLTMGNGDVLTFTGQPTAETRYGGPGEQIFLEVAADTRPCSHPLIPDTQCLQVREIHYDDTGIKTAGGDWRNFFDDIEEYTHEPGIRNVLRVKRFTRNPVPADASAHAYVLDMVVESETVEN